MVRVACTAEGCEWQTEDRDPATLGAVLAAELNIHATTAHTAAPAPAKRPVVSKPTVSTNIYAEEWASFLSDWEVYKGSVAIPDGQTGIYLVDCCSDDLRQSVVGSDPTIRTKTEEQVLELLKNHAVIRVAKPVLRQELHSLTQEHGESARNFAARVLRQARNAEFKVKCPHGHEADYTEEIAKQILIAGMHDCDIRQKTLASIADEEKSLNELIAIIEREEVASRATFTGASAIGKSAPRKEPNKPAAKVGTKANCVECKVLFVSVHAIRTKTGAEKIVTDRYCASCWKSKLAASKKAREEKKEGTAKPDNTEKPTDTGGVSGCRGFVGAASRGEGEPRRVPGGCNGAKAQETRLRQTPTHRPGTARSRPKRRSTHRRTTSPSASTAAVAADNRHNKPVPVPNQIFYGNRGWRAQQPEGHPVVTLEVSTLREDWEHLGLHHPPISPVKVQVIADSGCQASLIGLNVAYRIGLKKKDFAPVKGKMWAVNGDDISIIGAVFLRLAGVDQTTGQRVQTAVMAQVTDTTDRFWLSKQAMRELGMISETFPRVSAPTTAATSTPRHQECGCPARQPPPPRPDALPFEATEGNTEKMRAWLIERYAASAFNKCTHNPLPMMTGTPGRIHIDPSATPRAVYTASTVPLHWRDEVKRQLDQDVALGIIEKVESGTPTTWQARMHVVAKPDGTPRRTVDLRYLNTHCSRESYHTVPPYKQARMIPANVFKSVTDAWNGYHSRPLEPSDRHYTTFITEWGRYRYCVLPQGYLASGDNYNQYYDEIIAEVQRKTRCVDDVALWDEDREAHWWRVIDYLELVSKNGIVLNKEKFQFGSETVDFAGFTITPTEVLPLRKYIDAIYNFPRPTNITDIRSWYGLVNQVSRYGKLTEHMAPFRELLSPKTRFRWDDEMEEAFQQSKLGIIEAIKEGVRIFDPTRPTVLSPDYSKEGLGYFMYQQWCDCPSTVTTCCDDGWKITLAGSRFLHQAEVNYWPVEGELLATAWALEDTKFFTLGCTRLHLQVDHKPLVGLLENKTLDAIDNRRLVNLKEKTFPWNFTVSHVPGVKIPGPDAASRKPDDRAYNPGDGEMVIAACIALRPLRIHQAPDDVEASVVAAVRRSMPTFRAVTWERVRDETSRDQHLLALIDMAERGFPDSLDKWPAQLAPYWRFRGNLTAVDGVVCYGHRAVIPPTLRPEVVAHLHSAHQGVSKMSARAADCVFWPGITADIQHARSMCTTCDINAPSQSRLPPAEPEIPSAPFESVASDYFQLGGKHYLVSVDRLTNWPEVREAMPKTEDAGADGMIRSFRELFGMFGVPKQLSTDGGPQYTSKQFKEFLDVWGVSHRNSAAYNPESNGRAEVGVKSVKRLLRDNVDAQGRLNTDAVLRAMLQFRNTPDPDTGWSPAKLLLGRQLRDSLPLHPDSASLFPRTGFQAGDKESPVLQEWKDVWAAKEVALKNRADKMVDKFEAEAHELKPLALGDKVRVQNQTGNYAKKWDKTGVVVQIADHDQHVIRMDGSRRTTVRNRRFLRKMGTSAGKTTPTHLPPARESLPTCPVQPLPPPSPAPLPAPVTPNTGILRQPGSFRAPGDHSPPAQGPDTPFVTPGSSPPLRDARRRVSFPDSPGDARRDSWSLEPTPAREAGRAAPEPTPASPPPMPRRPRRETRPPARYNPEEFELGSPS